MARIKVTPAFIGAAGVGVVALAGVGYAVFRPKTDVKPDIKALPATPAATPPELPPKPAETPPPALPAPEIRTPPALPQQIMVANVGPPPPLPAGPASGAGGLVTQLVQAAPLLALLYENYRSNRGPSLPPVTTAPPAAQPPVVLPAPTPINLSGYVVRTAPKYEPKTVAASGARPAASPVAPVSQWEGRLLRGQGTPWVFHIEQGKKRWVTTEEVLNTLFGGWGAVLDVPRETLDQMPTGANLAGANNVVHGGL